MQTAVFRRECRVRHTPVALTNLTPFLSASPTKLLCSCLFFLYLSLPDINFFLESALTVPPSLKDSQAIPTPTSLRYDTAGNARSRSFYAEADVLLPFLKRAKLGFKKRNTSADPTPNRSKGERSVSVCKTRPSVCAVTKTSPTFMYRFASASTGCIHTCVDRYVCTCSVIRGWVWTVRGDRKEES